MPSFQVGDRVRRRVEPEYNLSNRTHMFGTPGQEYTVERVDATSSIFLEGLRNSCISANFELVAPGENLPRTKKRGYKQWIRRVENA